ncbi:MAG TPA: protein-disulfide reductase DsbD domain-containing protein, partial [Rubricoccaceae bacterium]
MRSALAVLIVAVCALASAARAQVPPGTDATPHSDVRLVAGAAAVAPGESVWVAVEIALEAGWHVYWINPGDSGLPVRAAWTLPEGAEAGPLRFPAPERLDIAGLTSYAHSGTPQFLARLAIPRGAADPFRVSADVSYLVCADVCLPARATVALSIPVAPETRPSPALDAALATLPRAATGWTTEASLAGETVRLRLVPPPGWTGGWTGAQFFPDSSGAVQHAAPQAFRRDGTAWAVDLAAGDAVPAFLSGVLTAPGAPAVVVRADVAGVAAMASAGTGLGLWAALGLALVGGLLLNVMPCVFPVLSLKLLSFAGSTDARAQRRAGLAYGAGVVVSFWVLVGALLALRAGGAGLGWGFQLQSPPVIAFLAVLMTGLALNLLGVVEMGGRLAAAGGALDRGTGVRGAFASGVLATVVATPCTAPLMGTALGFALAQPAPDAFAVFTALGVG